MSCRAPVRRRAVRTTRVPRQQYSGHGAYSVSGAIRSVASAARSLRAMLPAQGLVPGTGRRLGQALGGYLGPPGAIIGGELGDKFGKWSGMGAYKKSGTTISQDPPSFKKTKSGGVRIQHREYIQDVTSSVAFSNQLQLGLNPGLYNSFPWLSGIASNFTQYKMHGCIYEYRPTSGSAIASTNNALGTVIMATNYNASDSNFVNKQQMENEEMSQSTVPSSSAIHPIECDPKQTTIDKLYTRTGAVPSGQDIRLYDLGLFQLAVQGMQAGSITVGELWVSYDVEFFKPQLDTGLGLALSGAHYNLGSTWASATPLGTPLMMFDSIGLTFATSTVLTIPEGYVGKWMLVVSWLGAATSTLVIPAITLTNIIGVKLFDGDSLNLINAPVGGTDNSTRLIMTYTFTITSPSVSSTITFGAGGTLPGTPNLGDLILTQLPFNMAT